MKHCSSCGEHNEVRVPEGEDRERHVCSACGTIHYRNPKMVVGCIVQDGGRVLLCRRAIEPRRGFWTIPAGFMELGESATAGAARETLEEALARVQIVAPYAHFDIPHIGQAYLIYRAQLLAGEFGPGPESLEVQLLEPDAIPWQQLAFTAVRYALELFVEDLQNQRFRHHTGMVVRKDGRFALEDHVGLPIGNAE
ncbi:MAG: NUDIX hydrolase [Myxococcales bacterium]|nr:NUDIX hydrolase [Myxococcales bacterium]